MLFLFYSQEFDILDINLNTKGRDYMAYSFVSITKIKSVGTMTSKYNHNCRKVEIANVIPELTDRNDELVALPHNTHDEELDYKDAFKERVYSLDYYKNHNIRKNAVLGFEVLMTFSRDEGININEWKRLSMEWLHKTFDVAPDNKSNVLHAVCHEDEPGNIHIHAFVVPIDERGRLNAKRFTDGSRAMTDIQTSYAEHVAELGLERGLVGSSASHKNIRKMYAELNRAIDTVPTIKEGETAEQYRARILEILQTQRAIDVKKRYEANRSLHEKLDKERSDQYSAIKEYFEECTLELEAQTTAEKEKMKQLSLEATDLQDAIDKYYSLIDEAASKLSEVEGELERKASMKSNSEKLEAIKKDLELIAKIEPVRVQKLLDDLAIIRQMAEEERENQEMDNKEHKSSLSDKDEFDTNDILDV